mmetsp:Transcript_20289/g.50198  ORF Transcript_20289/g.50198 Transcript_20289/m.50198 type:complete len:163 (+) Transcript_20289:332-820(+)
MNTAFVTTPAPHALARASGATCQRPRFAASSFSGAALRAPAPAAAAAPSSGARMLVTEIESPVDLKKALEAAGEKLVCIDYSTTWCGPCKLIGPKFEAMSEEYLDVVFLKVVGDRSKETNSILKEQGIRTVPTFHFWKQSQMVYSVSGAKEEAILSGIKEHM